PRETHHSRHKVCDNGTVVTAQRREDQRIEEERRWIYDILPEEEGEEEEEKNEEERGEEGGAGGEEEEGRGGRGRGERKGRRGGDLCDTSLSRTDNHLNFPERWLAVILVRQGQDVLKGLLIGSVVRHITKLCPELMTAPQDKHTTRLPLTLKCGSKLVQLKRALGNSTPQFTGHYVVEKNAKDRRNYTDKELINDMIVPLLHQWTKANALFKPPVINQCRTIELKLTKLWHKAVETSLGKGNLARKNEFLHTLDTLFDILTCKCSIQLCSESNCSHSGKRENNSHIDCGCPREKKIPVLELEFIKAQRTKAEGQGSMQMGSIDYSETKKQIANAKKREQIREREQKKKMKSEEAIQREEELCQDVYHFFDIPPINVNATKLSELVDLSLEVLEPPLTTSLTSQELRNLKETPMQVPKWPSHTQSVERCVKMVTEAAGHVYSHERREEM
ncbi:hypothetical protein Hamer_G028490, partial [Homarus americanus]